jgi:transposase InsO family protein
MDSKLADAIALFRHQVISPVLMQTRRSQMQYFREVANREWDVPGRGPTRFSATTMKGWLRRYKKNGFTALQPKKRSDAGGFRRLGEPVRERIRGLRQEHLRMSVAQFYEKALASGALGSPPACQATLRRFLMLENLFAPKEEPTARKRFEMSRFGELWTGDFMHGPLVIESVAAKRRRKAILMAIIDDHSRVLPGAEFGLTENTLLLEQVFKQAILTHGLCDRLYVDNGAAFSSQYLARVCAHLGIGLVHSKPYDSPSRGKIERFFRTVREQFLSQLHPDAEITLSDLNERFGKWLRDDYHHRHHSGIDARPIDRYQASLALYPLRRIDEEGLAEFFLVSIERTVSRDCVVSLHGTSFEVPPAFVGKRVELRYAQDRPAEVYLYEHGVRVSRLQPVDTRYNARVYRPGPRDAHVPFQSLIAPNDPGVSS